MKELKRIWTKIISLPIVLRLTIILSLSILLISLTQPAFYIDRPEEPDAWSSSLMIFIFGWTFFLDGVLIPFLIWCANPLYFISIYLTSKGKFSGLYLSVIATGLAFWFSQLDKVITKESGAEEKIASFELGYKLWLISLLILTSGTILNLWVNKIKKNGST